MPRKSGPRRTRADPPPVLLLGVPANGAGDTGPRRGEVDELPFPLRPSRAEVRGTSVEADPPWSGDPEVESDGPAPSGTVICACLYPSLPPERSKNDLRRRPGRANGP